MSKKKTLVEKINDLIKLVRVPKYLHHFGPKTYTTIQHVKCWLLKEKLKCSWDDFVDEHAIYYGVQNIPEVSTLKKFVKRLPFWIKNKLVSYSAGLEPADFGAIDSTGLSRTNASQHYVKRIDREQPTKQALKLSMYSSKNRILSFRLRSKQSHDVNDVVYLTKQSLVLAKTNCLDKGYDAEWVHEHFRKQGVYSIIPARKGCERGKYRKEMRDYFDYSQYWERNCSEWNNSSLKRKFGDFVRSNTFKTQHSEVAARIILHNIMAFLQNIFTIV
jgi:hypothetical protein